MNISYTKIDPAGNITVVVDSFVPREQQSRVASELMKRDVTVEQVGFLEKPDDPCCAVRLQMMGGEFCGNASLSAAAVIFSRAGLGEGLYCEELFEVSGAAEPVKISGHMVNSACFEGEVAMPLPESISLSSVFPAYATR